MRKKLIGPTLAAMLFALCSSVGVTNLVTELGGKRLEDRILKGAKPADLPVE